MSVVQEWDPEVDPVHPTGGYDEIIRGNEKTAYHRGGVPHRLDGPAIEEKNFRGWPVLERWMIDGREHRADGPAYVRWDSRGEVSTLRWSTEGQLHRLDGPALIRFDLEGDVKDEGFFVLGHELGPEQWASFHETLATGAPIEWALSYATGTTS